MKIIMPIEAGYIADNSGLFYATITVFGEIIWVGDIPWDFASDAEGSAVHYFRTKITELLGS